MNAPLDLEGIKARLEAATPGPWRYVGNTVYIDPMSTNSSRQPRYWALPGDWETAALIANAPTDLAALVAEVEAMRAELESQERAHAEEIARYQARLSEAHRAHAGALDKLAWLGHVHSTNSRCAACAAYDERVAKRSAP